MVLTLIQAVLIALIVFGAVMTAFFRGRLNSPEASLLKQINANLERSIEAQRQIIEAQERTIGYQRESLDLLLPPKQQEPITSLREVTK